MHEHKKLSMSSKLAGLLCLFVACIGFSSTLEMEDATGGAADYLLYLLARLILPGIIMMVGLWLVFTANRQVSG